MIDPNTLGTPQNSVEQYVSDQAQDRSIQQASQTPAQNEAAEYAQIANLLSDLDRRLRTLEERYANLRKKLQLTDENLLESERSFGKEIKGINDETLDLKRSVSEFSDKLLIMDNEMSNVAQKNDLKVIEKYLTMWSPTNYVTRNELKEYLKNKGIKIAAKEDKEEE